MARISSLPKVELTVSFTVTESEARALDALAGYGTDQFIGAFYNSLGSAYLKPHEAGLRLFLDSVKNDLGPVLGRIDQARAAVAGKLTPRQLEHL